MFFPGPEVLSGAYREKLCLSSFLLPILTLPWITPNVEHKGLEVAEDNLAMFLSWKDYSTLKGVFGK